MGAGRLLRGALALITAVCLSSCGGGGGGGGGGGFSVSFDASSLVFDYMEGDSPSGQIVTAIAHGTPPASGVFVGAVVTGPGIEQPIYVSIDESTATATAYIKPMEGLAAGTYTGVVTLLACADELCHTHFPGSPHTVNYRISVHTRLVASPASVSFAVVEQHAVAPRTLQVSLPENVTQAQVAVTYGGGASNWLQVQNNGRTIVLAPQVSALEAGSYTAELRLQDSASGQTFYVPVSLVVSYDPLLHLRADKSSVAIAGPEAKVLPAETLQVGLPPAATGYTASVAYGAGASGWLQVQQTGNTVSLTASTVGRTPGLYAATLNLTSTGDVETLAIPVTLQVAYDALQHLRVDQSSLAFAAVETQVVSKTLGVGLPPSASGLSVTVNQGTGGGNWLQVQRSGGDLVVTANPAGLAPGTYSGSLSLAATDTSETLVVPVSYTLTRGLVALASDSVVIGMDSPGTGQFTVEALSGVSTTGWTASSNQPWLVPEATGTIGGALHWHLDPALFLALATNTDYVATITVSGNGLSPVTKQLTFNKQLKSISHVDTLALLDGDSGDVLLYGAGFASLQDFAARLQVGGGLVPAAVTVLSDRMASVRLENVPAGEYSISLASALGQAAAARTLRVLPRRSYPYLAIDTAGPKGAFVWDPVSQSAFATDFSLGRIHRFAWNGSTFDHATLATPTPFSLAMDREQATLVLATTAGEVRRYDPVTLEQLSTQTMSVPPAYRGYGVARFPLMVTGDGSVHIPVGFMSSNGFLQGVSSSGLTELLSINLDTGAAKLTRGNNNPFYFLGGPVGSVSGNGRRVLMDPAGNDNPLLHLDMLDNLLAKFGTSSPKPMFHRASSDWQGRRWLLGNVSMFDFDLTAQGSIASEPYWIPATGILSRDGTRAYVYTVSDSAISWYSTEYPTTDKARIYVYDTGPLPPALSNFPLLGYFELDDYAGCRRMYDCHFDPDMVVAPDGQTLLILGDTKFLSVPIPEAYRPGYVPPAIGSVSLAPVARHSSSLLPGMRYWRLKRG